MRFDDPAPRAIPEEMRTPGGTRLADNESVGGVLTTTAAGTDTLGAAAAHTHFHERIEGYARM